MSIDLSALPNPEAVERALRPGENLLTWDWDDTLLVEAYDMMQEEKAAEIRKRRVILLALMKEAAAIKDKFPVGSFCRAKYSGDGCYYEGKITSLNEFTCMVEFVGYKNSEEVDLLNLKSSKGKKARKNQIKIANETYAKNLTYAAESQDANYYEPSFEYPSSSGAAESSSYYSPSEVSQTMACPIPPEPPMPPCSVMNNPALSAMLMSWYMAGYYTGVHEIQKGAKKSCRHHH